jgi:hypothetical protein
LHEAKSGILETADPAIVLDLAELFRALDE